MSQLYNCLSYAYVIGELQLEETEGDTGRKDVEESNERFLYPDVKSLCNCNKSDQAELTVQLN